MNSKPNPNPSARSRQCLGRAKRQNTNKHTQKNTIVIQPLKKKNASSFNWSFVRCGVKLNPSVKNIAKIDKLNVEFATQSILGFTQLVCSSRFFTIDAQFILQAYRPVLSSEKLFPLNSWHETLRFFTKAGMISGRKLTLFILVLTISRTDTLFRARGEFSYLLLF